VCVGVCVHWSDQGPYCFLIIDFKSSYDRPNLEFNLRARSVLRWDLIRNVLRWPSARLPPLSCKHRSDRDWIERAFTRQHSIRVSTNSERKTDIFFFLIAWNNFFFIRKNISVFFIQYLHSNNSNNNNLSHWNYVARRRWKK